MTGTPRCHTAAANPATSVTIPPPTATTTSWRVTPAVASARVMCSMVVSDFAASPSPISIRVTVRPPSPSGVRASAVPSGMPACVTTATRRAPAGTSDASVSTDPCPTTTS